MIGVTMKTTLFLLFGCICTIFSADGIYVITYPELPDADKLKKRERIAQVFLKDMQFQGVQLVRLTYLESVDTADAKRLPRDPPKSTFTFILETVGEDLDARAFAKSVQSGDERLFIFKLPQRPKVDDQGKGK